MRFFLSLASSLLVFHLLPATVSSQTVLNAGDVAIVGVASNVGDDDLAAYCEVGTGTGRDRISIVCFKDITAGTDIDFTDNGWERAFAGKWGNSEGFLRITRTGGTIPAGTTITIEFPRTPSGLPPLFVLPDADWTYAQLGTRFCNLGSNGDQLYVLQGGAWNNGTGCPALCNNDATYTGGRFLYAFSTNGWVTTPPGTANTVFQSRLHPSLNPCYSVSIASNFCSYQSPVTPASKPSWINRIKTTGNWSTYADCNSFVAPPDIFPMDTDDVWLECANNCSGCAPFTATLRLKIGLPPAWGPFTVVYNNGAGNVTLNNATNNQLINVLVNNTTTYSIVSITAANGCLMTYSYGSVTITASPRPVFQNFSQQVCAGSSVDLSTLNYAGLNIAGCTFTFHTATPPNAGNQLPGSTVTVNATATYYGLATSLNGCLDTFPITLTAVQPPNAGIPQDTAFCFRSGGAANLILANLLQGENPGGTWSPAPGSANPGANFNAGAGTLNPNNLPVGAYAFNYTVSGNGGCPDDIATVNVTVTPGVAAGNAGPLSECGNGNVTFDLTLLNAAILNGLQGVVNWFSDVAGVNAINNPAAYASAGGTVYARISTPDGCTSALSPVVLNVLPLPNAGIANNPPAICFSQMGNPVIILANLLAGENPGGAWSPAPGGNDPGANFNAGSGTLDPNDLPAGSYSFVYTVNSPSCGSDEETVIIVIIPAPQAGVTVTPVSCNGGNNGSLLINAGAGLAPYQFNIGFGNQANNLFGNLVAGIYFVSVTDANGCTVGVSAGVAQPPVLNAGTVVTNASCGNSNGQINLTVTGGAGSYTYNWADLPGTNDPKDRTALAAGSYFVTATDGNGCTVTAAAGVVQQGSPAIAGVVTDASCAGSSNGSINVTVTGGAAPYQYDWADIPGNNNPEDRTGLNSGNYSATVTDLNGCTAVSAFQVSDGGSLSLNCSQLSPVSVLGASDGAGQIMVSGNIVFPLSVQWAGPVSGNQNFNAVPVILNNLPTGVYTVTVTNAQGCSADCGFSITGPDCVVSDSTFLTATTCDPSLPGVQVQQLVNQAGCDSIVITTVTLLPSDTTYLSQTSCDPAQVGVIVQTLNNANGCDSLVVTTTTLTQTVSGAYQATLCGDEFVQINGTRYDINHPSGTEIFPSVNGCDSIVSIQLTFNTLKISLAAFDPICFGEKNGKITFDAVINGAAPFSFSNDGVHFNSVTIPFGLDQLGAGDYPVWFRDSLGCRFDSTLELVSPFQLSLDLGDTKTIQLGDSIQLQSIANFTPDSLAWQYEGYLSCSFCLDPYVRPPQTSQYQLTAFDANGCSAGASVRVVVQPAKHTYVANAFSPNDDGENDLLVIYTDQSVRKLKGFRVYDRWGDVMFEVNDLIPNDPGLGWDGKYKGMALGPGVYTWLMEVEYQDGSSAVKSGDVTLIR